MEIKIKSMDIKNFKGIHSMHLVFHSGMNSLYGDNASGKTTVYDALIWLLFATVTAVFLLSRSARQTA